MKRDAPVAAIRIAVPVASVKKRRKTIFFRQKITAARGLDFYQSFSW